MSAPRYPSPASNSAIEHVCAGAPPLRRAVGVAFLFTLTILIGTLYIGSHFILLSGFAEVERQETIRNIRRVDGALDRIITELAIKAADWSAWDDSYQFAVDHNEEFITSNLNTIALVNLGVDAILFFDSRAHLIHGLGVDLATKEAAEPPAGLFEALQRDLLLVHATTSSHHAGIIMLPEGPAVVASRPILTSNNLGPVRGSVVFVRRLNAGLVKQLEEQTQLSISLFSPDDPALPDDCRAVFPSLGAGEELVKPIKKSVVAGYITIRDVSSHPALLLRIQTPRAVYRQGVLSMRWFIVSMVLVAVAISVATIVLLNRRVISPLERMSQLVQRIGEGHDAEPLSEGGINGGPRGFAELNVLAASINRMVSTITSAGDQLANHAAELKAKSEQLDQSRLIAEAANRAKTEFLANMSHEIRTPMTAVLGYTDLCMEPDVSDADREQYLRMIATAGNSLLSIINDILDISKIETGHLSVERVRMSPAGVVADVAALLGAGARAKGISLVVACDTPIPEVIHSDPLRFRQILTNIIGNAIKFTASGEVRVGVSIRRALEPPHDTLVVEVRDTGTGITPEQFARLFQPFTQADTSTVRRFGGTGLGLCISRRLAEALGGSIVAGTPGIGAVFTITLDPGPLDNVGWTNQIVAEPAALPVAAGDHAVAPPAPRPILRGRILLADDGLDNQRLLSHFLRRAGAHVDIVGDGAAAVDAARKAVATGDLYDLFLLDIQMPIMDGYTAARELRNSGIDSPIIALTAFALFGERDKCIAAGCDEYATKPISRAELLRVCSEWLDPAARARRVAAA